MDSVPPEAQRLFEESMASVSAEQVAALRHAVREHLEDFRRAARSDELLPLDLAEELAEKLDGLLREHATLPQDQAAVVVGATRYFVSEEDATADTSGVLGLDDDVAIFNLAVRLLGREDLVIDG